MVQKEVGERLIAKNTDREYGSISVILDFYGEVKILRHVPRRMFTPSPNVDSCVVQINFIKNKYDVDPMLFEKIVKSAFSNRRKTLANNLAKDFNVSKEKLTDIIVEAGFKADVRGDSLATDHFVLLTKVFDKVFNNKT